MGLHVRWAAGVSITLAQPMNDARKKSWVGTKLLGWVHGREKSFTGSSSVPSNRRAVSFGCDSRLRSAVPFSDPSPTEEVVTSSALQSSPPSPL